MISLNCPFNLPNHYKNCVQLDSFMTVLCKLPKKPSVFTPSFLNYLFISYSITSFFSRASTLGSNSHPISLPLRLPFPHILLNCLLCHTSQRTTPIYYIIPSSPLTRMLTMDCHLGPEIILTCPTSVMATSLPISRCMIYLQTLILSPFLQPLFISQLS